MIFQRYKNWYAAAYPGTWLEPRNAISFAKALGKLPEPIGIIKKSKVPDIRGVMCYVLCAQFYGKTIAELAEDWTSEPDGKRQKLLSDF